MSRSCKLVQSWIFIYFWASQKEFYLAVWIIWYGLYLAMNMMPTYKVSYTVLEYNHPYNIISLKAHIGGVFNFENLIGFSLRLIGIFKTISYYFLQNVWNCSLLWAYAFKICKKYKIGSFSCAGNGEHYVQFLCHLQTKGLHRRRLDFHICNGGHWMLC